MERRDFIGTLCHIPFIGPFLALEKGSKCEKCNDTGLIRLAEQQLPGKWLNSSFKFCSCKNEENKKRFEEAMKRSPKGGFMKSELELYTTEETMEQFYFAIEHRVNDH